MSFSDYKYNLENLIEVKGKKYVMNIDLFRQLYLPTIDQQDAVWACSCCKKILTIDERWCTECDVKIPNKEEYIDTKKKTLVCFVCGITGYSMDFGMHRTRRDKTQRCNVFRMDMRNNLMSFTQSTNYQNYNYSEVESIRSRNGFPSHGKFLWTPTKESLKIIENEQQLKEIAIKEQEPKEVKEPKVPKKQTPTKPKPVGPYTKRVSVDESTFKKVKKLKTSESIPVLPTKKFFDNDLITLNSYLNPVKITLPIEYVALKQDKTVELFLKDSKLNRVIQKLELMSSISLRDVLDKSLHIQYECSDPIIINKMIDYFEHAILQLKTKYGKLKGITEAYKKCSEGYRCNNCVVCRDNADLLNLVALQQILKSKLESTLNILEAKVLTLKYK